MCYLHLSTVLFLKKKDFLHYSLQKLRDKSNWIIISNDRATSVHWMDCFKCTAKYKASMEFILNLFVMCNDIKAMFFVSQKGAFVEGSRASLRE